VISKVQKLNSFLFLCTEFVKKWGNYSRGDIIQGGRLIKEITIFEKVRKGQ
jgi:hypothetical protein